MRTVLVVDDKELLRDSVGATLQRAGFGVVTAADGQAALATIAQRRPDAVVTDLKMPGMTGLELLQEIRAIDEDLPMVMMTAFGTVDTAVKAIKAGAFDYITKPFEGDELVIAVKRAIEHSRLRRENAVLKRAVQDSAAAGGGGEGAGLTGLDRIIGESRAIARVKAQVEAVAESHGTVLICGESGTGKEVIARAIHEMSPRRDEAYLAVNCAALSESLLESELFGHEKGAFTGAESLRKGRFELADRGTLLLDEISEVPMRVQAKLLRVLQERVLERVGSSTSIGVDVRIIATSNRDLPRFVGEGHFRQDLFFRLNVLPIHLPPLRDRLEDVAPLAEHFLASVARREGTQPKRLSDEALAVLTSYAWPGNVRELANICERAAVLCRGEVIDCELIEPWLLSAVGSGQLRVDSGEHAGSNRSAVVQASSAGSTEVVVRPIPAMNGSGSEGPSPAAAKVDIASVVMAGKQLEDIEREAILQTLTRFRGHRAKTAEALGIGVRTLGLKLKKWKELELVEAEL